MTRPAGVGDYRWIGDAAAFSTLLDELGSCDVYGLDTEFHREKTYFPHLALLQLSWKGGIALVDPLAVDVAPLAGVLDGPGLAVLHAAEQDLEVLERACGTVPSSLFDTQVAAGFLGQVSASLVNLVERILGIRLLKGDQLTDWTRRPLSAGQLAYAAGDVAYLLELREVIGARLEEMGRTRWAAEEFAILLQKDRSPTDPDEAWWRLPRSRQLRGPARGVAQQVAAWRERRAQRMNLPVRFVLPDLALLSIAQHPPRSREDLQRTRSLDGRHLGGGAATELLAAVAQGLEMPPGTLRLPPAHDLDQPEPGRHDARDRLRRPAGGRSRARSGHPRHPCRPRRLPPGPSPGPARRRMAQRARRRRAAAAHPGAGLAVVRRARLARARGALPPSSGPEDGRKRLTR